MILLAVGGAYHNALRNGFVWDDYSLVVENEFIRSFAYLPQVLTGAMGAGWSHLVASEPRLGYCRPLQDVAFMVDHALFGLDPAGFHATNIALHAAAAAVLYFFLARLFRSKSLALAASLLYCVHPVHTEVVDYISGRADSIALIFLLLALIAYGKYQSSGALKYFYFVLLAFGGALLSKETGLILIPLILVYDYFLNGRPRWRPVAVLGLVVGFYFFARFVLFGQFSPDHSFFTALPERLPGFFVALARYCVLLIAPRHLHPDYGTVVFAYTDPESIAGAAIAAVLLVAAVRRRRSDPLLGFFIAWFFVTLLPVSNVFYPLPFFMAEHYLYLPSIGAIAAVVLLVGRLAARTRLPRWSVAAACCVPAFFLASATVAQNGFWKDDVVLFERALSFDKESAKAYNNLGVAFDRMKRYEEAVETYQKALQVDPKHMKTYNNLAAAYLNLGQDEKAVSVLRQAVTLWPSYALAHLNLAKVFLRMGDKQRAMKHYRRAVELGIKPDPRIEQALAGG